MLRAVQRLLLVCVAGALGTGTRYLLGLWAAERLGTAFPYGTLIVNIVGCFAIAVVAQLAIESSSLSDTARLTLTTGFMGGLTTYSSFAYETTKLFRDGARGAALLNLGVTTVSCFVAVLLGLGVAQLVTRAS